MELVKVKDAFERAVKKQKLSISKSEEVIDQVGQEIEQALAHIQSSHDPGSCIDSKVILADLKTKLNALTPHEKLEGPQKELNGNLSKYQKVLEKVFIPDLSKAYRNVDFDVNTLNEVIVNHLYNEGQFDIADCLVNEAGKPEVTALRLQFIEMHRILEAMKSRNLEPALSWVCANRERLDSGSSLELKLRGLQYLNILQNRSQQDALCYARTYLAPLASPHMTEVQKLMGCLVWAGKLEKSPYSELISPTQWEKLAVELNHEFCALLGQSRKSPLSVAIAAGVDGLPTLLKLAHVMAAKKQEWQSMKQLPVPVELGKEFQFHSVFVCPVSRDQGNEENPPMLLPCGHVLCKQSIHKLSKNSTRAFKCPYCPFDATVSQCKQLYF
nr:protein RMD5 homolog [Ipomoea batatas]